MIEASSRRLSMVLADRWGTARRPSSPGARWLDPGWGCIPRVGEAVTETVEPGAIAEALSSTSLERDHLEVGPGEESCAARTVTHAQTSESGKEALR